MEEIDQRLKKHADRAKVRKDPVHKDNWLFEIPELNLKVGIPAKTEAEARDLLEASLEREKKEGRIKG